MLHVEDEPFRHLPSSELRRLIDGLVALGLDRAELCAAAEVGVEEPLDEGARVPADVCLSVLSRAQELSGDEHVGLHAAEHSDLNDVTTLLAAAQPDVRASLGAFCRFQFLLFGAEPLTMRADSSAMRIAMSPGDDPSGLRHLFEYYTRTLCREWSRLTGEALRPFEVRFAHRPVGAASAYTEAFGCHVTFYAHEPTILLPQEGMDTPLKTANPSIAFEMTRLAEAQLQEFQPTALVECAERAIRALIVNGEPVSCETVARGLGRSVRTFQRQLAHEHLTFVGLRDSVRERLTTAILADFEAPGSLPTVAQLADAVGYSEPSALCRAFRRWTGASVGTYLRRGGD